MEGPELWNKEYLGECFEYNPTTGIFVWKRRPKEHFETERGFKMFNTRFAGKRADKLTCQGYRRLRLLNKSLPAHRVAYLLYHGDLPAVVDHKNRDRQDNSISNLRGTNQEGNTLNALPRGGSSRYKGVYKQGSSWIANGCSQGKTVYLGIFKSEVEAAFAYDTFVESRPEALLNRDIFEEIRDAYYPSPWLVYPDVWPTKAKFFTWMRGALRRYLWGKNPIKISFKKGQLTPPPGNYTGKARSGAACALTGGWYPNSKLEVDHVDGDMPLNEWDDLEEFILHCVWPSKLQLVEKEAHKIKSYAERMGITFEEAIVEKQVIAFKKLKAGVQKEILIQECIFNPEGLNLNKASDRAEAYRRHLLQGGNDVNRSPKGNPNSRK